MSNFLLNGGFGNLLFNPIFLGQIIRGPSPWLSLNTFTSDLKLTQLGELPFTKGTDSDLSKFTFQKERRGGTDRILFTYYILSLVGRWYFIFFFIFEFIWSIFFLKIKQDKVFLSAHYHRKNNNQKERMHAFFKCTTVDTIIYCFFLSLQC